MNHVFSNRLVFFLSLLLLRLLPLRHYPPVLSPELSSSPVGGNVVGTSSTGGVLWVVVGLQERTYLLLLLLLLLLSLQVPAAAAAGLSLLLESIAPCIVAVSSTCLSSINLVKVSSNCSWLSYAFESL